MSKLGLGKQFLAHLKRERAIAATAVTTAAAATVASEDTEASTLTPFIKEGIKAIDSRLRPTAPSSQSIKNTRTRAKGKKGTKAAQAREVLREKNPETLIETLPSETRVIGPEEIYEEYGGRQITNIAGDVTDAATIIHQVAGVPLRRPVNMEGGYKYSRLNEGDWASTLSPAQAQSGKYQEIYNKYGDDPVAMFVGMDFPSGNFSTMLPEVSIDMLETLANGTKITEKTLEQFDRAVRNVWVRKQPTKAEKAAGKKGRKVKRFPDWKGVSSKLGDGNTREERFEAAYQQLTDKAVTGDRRKAFMETLSKAGFREQGFPDWRDIYEATTAERLIDEPVGSSGAAIMIPDSLKGISADPTAHRTYTNRIHGKHDVGELLNNVAWQFAFPKTAKLLAHKSPGDAYTTLRTGSYYEPIDEQWLDSMMQGVDEAAIKAAYKATMKGEAGNSTLPGMALLSVLTGLGTLAASNRADASVFGTMLTETVKALPMKKGSVEQMVNSIKKGKGVSNKEIEMIDWTKLDDKKSITKEELGEFVGKESPKIKSVENKLGPRKADDLPAFYDDFYFNKESPETFDELLSGIADEQRIPLANAVAEIANKKGSHAIFADPELDLDMVNTTDIDLPKELYEEIKNTFLEQDGGGFLEVAKYHDAEGVDGNLFSHMKLSGDGKDYTETYYNLESQAKFSALNGKDEKSFSTYDEAEEYVHKFARENNWDPDSEISVDDYIEQTGGVEIKQGHMDDQTNNMFWTRSTARTGPNGEKIKHVEEIQTDARKNKELKKLLPKDWDKKALNAVMKEAKDQGYDGVTFSKKASQVAEIEKWGKPGVVGWYEPQYFRADNPTEEIFMDDEFEEAIDMLQEGALSEGVENPFSYLPPSATIGQVIKELDKAASAKLQNYVKYSNDIDKQDAAQIKEVSDQFKALEKDGVGIRGKPSGVDADDPASYDESKQRVIKTYTDLLPKYAEDITGNPVQSLEVDGHELNYIPVKDVEIPEPVFFGTPKKAAAAAAVVTAASATGAQAGVGSRVIQTAKQYGDLSKKQIIDDHFDGDYYSADWGDGRAEVYRKAYPNSLKTDIINLDDRILFKQEDGVYRDTPFNQIQEEFGTDEFQMTKDELSEMVATEFDETLDDVAYGHETTSSAMDDFLGGFNDPEMDPLYQAQRDTNQRFSMGFDQLTPEKQAEYDQLLKEEKSLRFAVGDAEKTGEDIAPIWEAIDAKREKITAIREEIESSLKPKVVAGTAGTIGSGTVLAEEQPVSLGQQYFPDKPAEIPETPEQIANKTKEESWLGAASRYVEDKTGLPINQITSAVSEMATGERRHNALPEDVRNLPEFREGWNTANSGDPLTDAKISAGFLATGDPKLRRKILEANVPGVEFIEHYEDSENPEGEPIVEVIMPDGERSLLNKPGWSQSDAETLTVAAAAFTPAGRVATTAARAGLGLGNQMVRAGGASMLTDAAMQETAKQMGSGAEYDLTQGLVEGGLGAIVPPAGAAWRGMRGAPDPYVSTLLTDLQKYTGDLKNPIDEVMKKVTPLAGPQ